MNTSLNAAIREAYAIAPTDKHVIHTLEIRQTGVQLPIFISKTRVGIIAFDEDGEDHSFIACGFDFSLPPSSEDGFLSLTVAVDNIDRKACDFIDTASQSIVPVEVVYRPYLSDDLSVPAMNPPILLFLKDVQITTFQVVGKCTFMDLVNKKFPSELYLRDRFPALG